MPIAQFQNFKMRGQIDNLQIAQIIKTRGT